MQRLVEPGQFTSVRFTERLDEIGARPSIGTVADSYDCEHDGAAVRPGLTLAMTDFVSLR